MTDPVFFRPARLLSAADIADMVGGRLASGDPLATVTGVAPLDKAAPGDLTFLDNPRYLAAFRSCRASVVICAEKHAEAAPEGLSVVVAREPYRAMAQVLQALFPDATRLTGPFGDRGGIADGAHVHPEARLEDGVTVEPAAVVGAGAEIGSGTVISAGAVIGAGVRIGRDGYVGPGASILFALVGNRVIIHGGCRIGQDGFGFAMGPRGHLKVPQVGRVVIQDDVEIGANTTIDRGANRDTIVGEGTKIDNQVQIGHNVVIGRHAVIVAQAGIAGSTVIGDFVAIGGQAGISGHITIGPGAQVAGASSVKDDVPAGARYVGIPAQPVRDWTREQAAIARLVKPKPGETTP